MKAQAIKLVKKIVEDRIAAIAKKKANKAVGENVTTIIDLINDINSGRKKIVIPKDRSKVRNAYFLDFFPDVSAKIAENSCGDWRIEEKLTEKFSPYIQKLELDLMLGDDETGRKLVEDLLTKIEKEAA